MQERVDLMELAKTLIRNRRFILICTVGALAVSAVVSLIMPQWFKARASILPPESGLAGQDIASIMRFAGYRPANIPTITSPSEIYSAILRSNRITDAVIDSLDLIKEYRCKSREDVKEIIWSNAWVSVSPEGLVLVDYEDRKPPRAAAVANAFVAELERFYSQTRVTSARRVRELIERRLGETKQDLETAQTALKTFKESTGAIMIPEQTSASIETAAALFSRIAELEVSLARIREFATDISPEVIDTKSQIRALEHKLAEMGYADSGPGAGDAGGTMLFPKFSSAPTLEQRLAELLMAVEIKTSVYKVLSEQYEEARIHEMEDTPAIQVLDWAQPPRLRSKPKRKLIVGVSTVAAFLISSLWVVRRGKARVPAAQDQGLAL